MKAGRKNLRRACDEGAAVTLAEGESIMQVLTLRGSNVIEVRRLLMLRGASGSSHASFSFLIDMLYW